MKTLLFILLLIPAALSAQIIRYDTIPASRMPSQGGFRYEIPPAATNRQSAAPQETVVRKRSFDPGKLVLGGSLGLGFGNDYTTVNISPQLGYAFSRYITAGGGLSYNYYRWKDYVTYNQNYMGGNLYLRFSPIPYVHLQVQPEIYGMWGRAGSVDLESRTVPTCLVGGGATIPSGARGGITAMFFYDVMQNDWSPYGGELVYSVGYTFNF